MNSQKQSQKPAEKTDKFGYASLMVGDSAALFTRYMEEYGTDYGMAARNIGQAFAATTTGSSSSTDGSSNSQVGCMTQTILSGQRLLEAATACMPLGVLATLVTLSSHLVVAASHIYQARQGHHQRIGHDEQEQHYLAQANHLFQTTRPDVSSNLVAITEQYGREDQAEMVHLVVTDSYQAAQLRLCLYQQQQQQQLQQTPPIKVFVSLQDALDAASIDGNKSSERKRVLIYFHTLVPTVLSQKLHIRNCPDFVLRADHDVQGKQRLVLTGTVQISNSKGTIHSVVLPKWSSYMEGKNNNNNNNNNNTNNNVELVQCHVGPKTTNRTTSQNNNSIRDSTSTNILKMAGVCLLAAPIATAAVATSGLLLNRR